MLVMNIILASNSPRRKEILSKAGFSFSTVPSTYNENIQGLQYSKDLVINCAYNKALDVSKKFPESLIIGADTVVVHKNIILGKPKDENDAYLMLKSLSNDTHFVATAVCIIYDRKTLKDIDLTYVTFRNLSDSDILNYIKSKKPFDKAGSYGIQDEGFDFATNVEGELDNVIGFPLKLFRKLFLFI